MVIHECFEERPGTRDFHCRWDRGDDLFHRFCFSRGAALSTASPLPSASALALTTSATLTLSTGLAATRRGVLPRYGNRQLRGSSQRADGYDKSCKPYSFGPTTHGFHNHLLLIYFSLVISGRTLGLRYYRARLGKDRRS